MLMLEAEASRFSACALGGLTMYVVVYKKRLGD
jgi:hypothetical protein